MKPDWDKLGEEYASSSSVVIGDADCTASGKEICSDMGVSGYPTIKYFTAETGAEGKPYQGGRSFDDLKKFVDENLAAKCLIDDTEGCTDKELKFMEKMKGDDAAVAKQLARLKKMKGNSMKPELKTWLFQRLAILEQLSA